MTKNNDSFVDEFLSVDKPSIEQETQQDSLHCEAIGDHELIKKVIAALSTVYDPEIPVNIYDLGLIYKLEINTENEVNIEMTLTAPGCPVAHLFPSMVQGAVESVDEITSATVEIVWDPPWTQDRMSDAARLELGMF